MAANQALLGTLATRAGGKGVTPAQLALSWVPHEADVIVPIPGALRARHLEENASAAAVVLSANELAAIDRATPRTAISGQRRQGDPRLQRRVDLRLVLVGIARSVYRVVPKQGPPQARGSSVGDM